MGSLMPIGLVVFCAMRRCSMDWRPAVELVVWQAVQSVRASRQLAIFKIIVGLRLTRQKLVRCRRSYNYYTLISADKYDLC